MIGSLVIAPQARRPSYVFLGGAVAAAFACACCIASAGCSSPERSDPPREPMSQTAAVSCGTPSLMDALEQESIREQISLLIDEAIVFCDVLQDPATADNVRSVTRKKLMQALKELRELQSRVQGRGSAALED